MICSGEGGIGMYKKSDPDQMYLDDFKIQFNGKLRKDNRWVRQSKLIPWEIIEESYSAKFSKSKGMAAINARIAFGALYIKESEGLSDRQTVEFITENPYAQYFLGMSEFVDEPLFDASMMVHFRKRFPSDIISKINQMIFMSKIERQLPS
jgi:hypothetical protein